MKWLNILWQKIKVPLYDSYTGWKKRRIAIAASVCVGVIACTIVVGYFTLSGNSPFSPSDSSGGSEISGDPNRSGAETELGQSDATQRSTHDDGEFKPNDRYIGPSVSAAPVLDEPTQWWEPPAINDIQADGGIPDDTKTEVIEDNPTTPANTTKYTSWSTSQQLRGIVAETVEKVSGNYLLYMDTVLERGDWKSFASDAVLILADVPLIGEQIRNNLDGGTAAVWDELEPILIQLRTELNTCESADDVHMVAGGETRQRAIELTTKFLTVSELERV